MDALSAIIDFLLWMLGIYQETTATREQCAQMWEQGYVVYPLSEEQQQRAKQCAELMRDSQ